MCMLPGNLTESAVIVWFEFGKCVCCPMLAICMQIEIGEERKHLFIEQLAVDAAFLRDHGIMDYSLLLGISYANRSQGMLRRELPLWNLRLYLSAHLLCYLHSAFYFSAGSLSFSVCRSHHYALITSLV